MWPGASSISPIRLCARASSTAAPPAMPITPTGATSPSSRALVAWVVLWARKTTSRGSIPERSSTAWKTSTTPAETPRSWACVVGTAYRPTTCSVALSIRTALVKVPPTSIPIRYALVNARLLWTEVRLAGAAVEDLDLPADDGGVGRQRFRRAVGAGTRLGLEVVKKVATAHQRGAVLHAHRLLHMRGDVADRKADAPVPGLVRRRAVRQQYVVQGRLSR